MSTVQFAVVADDLSGGMITAVQFTAAGLRPVVVAAGHTPVQGVEPFADMVPMWDTASRADQPEVSRRKVGEAVRRLRRLGSPFLYKQSDSQLRGNLGAELAGLLEESGAPCVLCCFANPDVQRITAGGTHFAGGRPVHEGPAGADPVTPVTESHVPTLLERQLGRPVIWLGADPSRQGAGAIRAALEAAMPGAPGAVLVADAASEADLDVLAEAVLSAGLTAACGSYGFARALARVWAGRKTARQPSGGVLVLAGSTTELVRTQVAVLGARPGTAVLTLPPNRALSGEPLDSLAGQVRTLLAAGSDVAVATEGSPAAVQAAHELGARLGISPVEVHHRIAAALGEIARLVGDAAPGLVRGIVATGGDTACAAYQRIGQPLELVAEPFAGAATGVLRPGGTPFAAKSGACGGPDGLCILVDSLKQYACAVKEDS